MAKQKLAVNLVRWFQSCETARLGIWVVRHAGRPVDAGHARRDNAAYVSIELYMLQMRSLAAGTRQGSTAGGHNRRKDHRTR